MPEATVSARFTLLREVFDLAKEQRRAIDGDDLEGFGALLERRQALIEQLVDLSSDAGSPLPENVIVFPGVEVTADEDDTLALDTLIRGILEHDRQNEALLAEMMEGIRSELLTLNEGARSVARYTGIVPGNGFIDRVS